jgi:hypothetical protein
VLDAEHSLLTFQDQLVEPRSSDLEPHQLVQGVGWGLDAYDGNTAITKLVKEFIDPFVHRIDWPVVERAVTPENASANL